MSEPSDSLHEQFGGIDVYLFDQLLRGRIVSGMKVLDASRGLGRNLIFLMRAGFDVWVVDESEEAIAAVQRLATDITADVSQGRFRVESMSHDTESMDVVRSKRSAPLRTRRQPLAGNGARDVESARAGRPALRSASDDGAAA